MAREWIKWIKGLEGKREVVAMAIKLRPTGTLVTDCEIIAAKWMKVWSWADSETADGHVGGVSADFVDAIAGLPGFFAAAEVVGWAWSKDQGVSFANWGRHNGENAKARAMEQAKKAAQRQIPHACPDSVPMTSGQDRDQRREEKRREEIQGISLSPPAEPIADPPLYPNEPHPQALIGDGFRRWWATYPPHIRGNMSECMRLWSGMNLEPKTDAVLAGLEAWKKSKTWAIDKKINRGDRWLADGKWEAPPQESDNGPDSGNQPHRRPTSEEARRAADRAQRVGGGEVGPIPILGKRTAG